MCAFPSPVLCTQGLECEALLSLPLQVHLVPSHSISVTLESFFLPFSPEGLSRAVYPLLASFPSESRAGEHEGEGQRSTGLAWEQVDPRLLRCCAAAHCASAAVLQLSLGFQAGLALCLGLCSCLCPFVMECHPCSGSCFHPSTAAPWRVAGCKAAAQKRGVFCVSSTAQLTAARITAWVPVVPLWR